MEKLKDFVYAAWGLLADVMDVLSTPLFSIGNASINFGLILYLLSAFVILFLAAGKMRHLLVKRILVRYNLDIGVIQSIGTISRYIIIVTGIVIIVQSVGIDLSALGIMAGALGVGIGFGLQTIANNFISGLIILFERPIKVGDRIEVGDVKGDVTNIAARATTVLTNDNISVIVPNSEFISKTVINWSHNDRKVQFRFPVGVAYKEDPQVVKEVLLYVANKHAGVLRTPEPKVFFDEYGESSLNFKLLVWTTQYTTTPSDLKSQLYFDIFKQFKERGIDIPFPQRDLYIKSMPDKHKGEEILEA